MSYLAVPGAVGAERAEVWLGAFDEELPADSVLRIGIDRHERVEAWSEWAATENPAALRYQRITIDGLAPGTNYELRLLVGGVIAARAAVRTLPSALPTVAERPFVALLGSCFFAGQDLSGNVGRTFAQLSSQSRPDVKFLCGDQVYLDAPWSHFLWHTHGREKLAGEFLATYRDAWTQAGTAGGFRELLTRGANYFTSDDHDFWNNAPSAGAYVRDTWAASGREQWLGLARQLFEIFQSPERIRSFSVGGLEFLVADTRIARRPDRTQFMDPGDLQRVVTWLGNLGGPGVLVLGQSLFSSKAGFWGLAGYVGDWGLPDFEQYADLLRAILAAQHSVVLLTGDVHFGRITTAELPSGHEMVEVISSPMALVDPLAKGKAQPAPARLPAAHTPGLAGVRTSTLPFDAFVGADNHFATVEFAQDGHKVQMTTKVWPIGAGARVRHRVADRRVLQ